MKVMFLSQFSKLCKSSSYNLVSISFVVGDALNVAIIDSKVCVYSQCNRYCKIMFEISIWDKFLCATYTSQNITDDGCVSFAPLQMSMACSPYYVTVEAYNKTIYTGLMSEIQGHTNYHGPKIMKNNNARICLKACYRVIKENIPFRFL